MNKADEILKLKKEMAKSVNNAKAALKRPAGNLLTVYKCRDYYYWRYTDKETGERVTIPQSDMAKAEKMAVKTYIRYKMEYEVMFYDALSAFEKEYDSNMKTPEEYLLSNPGMAKLVLPNIVTPASSWKSWSEEDYYSNAGHYDNLKFKTLKGHNVRSKSEVIIADTLYKNDIPYRYEYTQDINGQMFSPDITAVNVQTGDVKLWEHAGLMDDPIYVSKLSNKLAHYTAAGYRLGINLIITTETLDHPLDSAYVQEIIDMHFR